MAHDTKTLLRDGSGITPVPQFFNPTADDFRPLTGVDLGNGRYGADGLIWGKTSGGVYVPVKCNADGAVVTELSGSSALPTGASTEAKQDALNAIIGEKQTSPTANTLLARIKNIEDKIDAITNGTTPAVTQLSGSIETVVDNPATGIKTITTTAAELFAGAYAKTNRRKLILKNEDQSLRFRIGKADITQQNGFPVEPGAVVIIPFDPDVIVPIYAISEGASLQASVMEV